MSFRVIKDGDFDHIEGKDGETFVISLSITGAGLGTLQASITKLGNSIILQLSPFLASLGPDLLHLSGFPAALAPAHNLEFIIPIISNDTSTIGRLDISSTGSIIVRPMFSSNFSIGLGGIDNTAVSYLSK